MGDISTGALFFVCVGLGFLAAAIAQSKGYPFWGWLLFGVFLPIIALPMALFAKPNTERTRTPDEPRAPQDDSPGHGWWKATDGDWYPPEQHPNYRPPPPKR